LAAKRTFSRFHQSVIGDVVPWLLPGADELARGADVLLLEKGVVAVQPRDADKVLDGDGQPAPFVQLQLHFGAGGQLVERRLVRMPDRQLLWRQCYDADGTVRTFDGPGDKATSQVRYPVSSAQAPLLAPTTKDLVVVPMPLRTADHLFLANP